MSHFLHGRDKTMIPQPNDSATYPDGFFARRKFAILAYLRLDSEADGQNAEINSAIYDAIDQGQVTIVLAPMPTDVIDGTGRDGE